MTILVTNDDGIDSPGLRALVEGALLAGMKTVVAAPTHDMSGLGKSFMFPVEARETLYPGAEKAWTLDGPPAAIVYTALHLLLEEKPRLVASGVNHGPNLGTSDLLTSATIGAAVEAAFHGVPGLAVSHWRRSNGLLPDHDLVRKVVAASIRGVTSLAPKRVVIVVNIPENPHDAMAVRPAFNRYDVELVERNGKIYPVMDEHRIYSNHDPPEGTDLWAFRNRIVSVVPLGVDPPLCSPPEGWRVAWRVAEEIRRVVRRKS